MFLWLLTVSLSSVFLASGELDKQCFDNCDCCKNKECGQGLYGWENACSSGCIDRHRGARCYELCKYENCKSCGFNDDNKTCTACYDGYYLGLNKDCALSCPSNCKSCTSSTYCTECKDDFYNDNSSTACPYQYCPASCECKTRKSPCESCKKGFYDTSLFCSEQCPVTCIRCESEDLCNECKNGFYNGYYNDDNTHLQLNNCTYKCRDNCTNCQSYNDCLNCIQGKYGTTCQNDCSVGCKNKTCSTKTGNCECTSGFTGDTCMACVNGQYGLFCNQTCHKYCKGNICRKLSGDCIEGCINVYLTGRKCSKCIVGMFGELCNNKCPRKCKNRKCQRYSGNCREGCIGHFNGTKCDQCKHGKYGENCDLDCPVSCADNICERYLGTCYDCVKNFKGEKCDECKSSYYGPNCDEPCSQYCTNHTCDRDTGKCITGCTSGYSGDKCCIMSENCAECLTNIECKRCVSGYFNNSCNETCLGECNGPCDFSTGECIYTGQTGEPMNLSGSLAAGVAALIIVVAGIIVSILIVGLRSVHKSSCNDAYSTVIDALTPSSSNERVETERERPAFANIKEKRCSENVLGDVALYKANDSVSGETDFYICNPVYMNIPVEDLFSYIRKDNFKSLENEFKNLPKAENYELSTLCKTARKAENIASNRYYGVYPFDHSRVTIPGEPEFFINASYIDGYSKSKAYIASFGPTSLTTEKFRTFWRMVWNEKSDIIVMLTNLHEASGMKCEQYWPEEYTEECYGLVKVKCDRVDEFSEYTVRSFTISKGKQQRNLMQIQFTVWPDSGVPSEVASLVDFRQRVKAEPTVLEGPVIVHCSAGIGRTGTYIALDILSDQGKAERLVNVFNCVQKLRAQRINMVQTAEQYIFLHKALVHTLTFGCGVQTAEEIQRLTLDGDSIFMNMFQTLNQNVDSEHEEDIAAREENKRKYTDKSRRHSDIPGNRGRVRLYLQRKAGNHDYINAVFINSFKLKNLFIAAQTPQSGTVEDFLCMIYQQSSCCIVALDDPLQQLKKYDVGVYIPADNETYRCGDFSVTSVKCETKSQYTVKKITIKHFKKVEETVSYHFQYKEWGRGQKVPESPEDFVQFITDIAKYVTKRAADIPNVVVHCLNGYERSGMFCVVYTMLEKLEAEGQVSVANNIRRVRAQRKLSISSVEQLKFCYHCILAYLKSQSTY